MKIMTSNFKLQPNKLNMLKMLMVEFHFWILNLIQASPQFCPSEASASNTYHLMRAFYVADSGVVTG